jgi:Leucine-rich repeat (LRR) protein
VAKNKLHGHLPSDLGKRFPNIQQSGIGENRFTVALPPSLTNLSRLKILYAAYNSFTGIVPSKFGRFQNLEVIVLGNNMLEANNEKECEFILTMMNCSRLHIVTYQKLVCKFYENLKLFI